MSVTLDGFNRIARYYDRLKRLVFGNVIYESQVHFLTSIPRGCNVLILGGGSGEILTSLTKMDPEARIWYVEASSRMLSLAFQRLSPEYRRNVTFIHGTDETLPEGVVFGAVITHFFLDLFPDIKVLQMSRKIRDKLCESGVWLVSDFVDSGAWWQRRLLWLMYRFFIFTCGIGASGLPRWEDQLYRSGMREIRSSYFFRGFIKTVLYHRFRK